MCLLQTWCGGQGATGFTPLNLRECSLTLAQPALHLFSRPAQSSLEHVLALLVIVNLSTTLFCQLPKPLLCAGSCTSIVVRPPLKISDKRERQMRNALLCGCVYVGRGI